MKRIGILALLRSLGCAMALAGSMAAQATVTRIDFTGSVRDLTSFGDPGSSVLQGQVNVGDLVTGTVRFSDDNTTGFTSPTEVFYTHALQSFSLTVGAFHADATGGIVGASNDHQAGSAAPFRDGLRWDAFDGVTGDAVSGVPPVRLQLSLLSADLGVLGDTELPDAADILAMWADNVADGNTNFMVWFTDQASSHEARFALTSLTVTVEQVPEPAALSLAMLGLLLVARRHTTAASAR